MNYHSLSHDELSSLCLGLSLFLHAGVDSGSALSVLAEEEKDTGRKALLSAMSAHMDDGHSMYDAFQMTGAFPAYVCHLVQIGEATGRTEETLQALAEYYDHRARLDRRLRSALLYPAVLLMLMLAVIVVLLTRVLPVFSEVYASLGGQLTGIAGGLLSFGQVLNSALPLLCVLLGVAVLALGAFAASSKFREKVLGLWRVRFGDRGVSCSLNTARFAQALSMGLSSGLPIEDALRLAATLLEDLPSAKQRCDRCLTKLEDGVSLAHAMAEADLLPQSECRLLELGMRSGCQDAVMAQIAERLSEAGDAALEARIGQIEPTLVVFTSVLVGIILLSVMLPLMDIMTAIG